MQSYRWTSFPYLFLMTLVILSFQNCSSQYQISQSDFGDQASFNSPPTPAIIFNPAPSVINAADYDLSFSIDIIEEQIRSVECRINTLASFDCSNRLIELRNLADGSYTIIVNVTTTGGVSAENSIVIRKDSNAQAEPGINMRMVFMATGHQARTIMSGPYRTDTLHFIPETSFTLFENQKDHQLVQL